MFGCGVLDNIMKIDDVISCSVAGLITEKDRDSILSKLDCEELANKCARNWEFAKIILNDNFIIYNIDGTIQFRIENKIYRVNVSALGYGIEIGDSQTLKYNKKVRTMGRRAFKRFIDKISGI